MQVFIKTWFDLQIKKTISRSRFLWNDLLKAIVSIHGWLKPRVSYHINRILWWCLQVIKQDFRIFVSNLNRWFTYSITISKSTYISRHHQNHFTNFHCRRSRLVIMMRQLNVSTKSNSKTRQLKKKTLNWMCGWALWFFCSVKYCIVSDEWRVRNVLKEMITMFNVCI